MAAIIAGVIGMAILVMIVQPSSPAASIINGFFNVVANLVQAAVRGGE